MNRTLSLITLGGRTSEPTTMVAAESDEMTLPAVVKTR